jgi:hypothetical protein
MPTDRDASTLMVTPECALPALTPDAARVLLRILLEARDKQLVDDGGAPDMRDERGIA